jgi:RNA polymerase sigma factor (sigma-70 family)
MSISSRLGTATTFSSAFGIQQSAATSVPRLGAPPMAELLVDAVPVPHLDPVPRFPGWEDERPEPVPQWDRVRSRPRAICPTREDRASTRNERTGQEIRVLLVDDHLAFRQPLAFMLMREPDITIIGQAGTVAEARPLLAETDIALIDLDLPDGEGVELIQDLHAVNPQAIALVLTGSSSEGDLPRAVEAGAAGLMPKTRPVSEVTDAIRRVHAGESLLSVRETIELLRRITQQREHERVVQATIERLTPREREVLQTLAAGLSDREIAAQLHVSTETVRTHMVNLLHKLGVDSRLKALVFAVRHKLVTID